MLDINFSDFHIPTWMIYTASIGFFFCTVFCIAGISFLVSGEYSKSTFIYSAIIISLILLCFFLSKPFPDNIFLLFAPIFTISFDIISFILLFNFISPYFFLIVSLILKFLAAFGFVGIIQKYFK
jgi:hypothetical protein